MAIPNPNPNIADGVKCDNKTYSSNKIESLISAATELPIPEAGDAGKVLTVNSDEDGYELDTPATYPQITYKEYEITLESNSYVTPFSHYKETDISADIPTGAVIQSVVIYSSATNVCTNTVNNVGKLRIYGTKAETVAVIVFFYK